MKVILHGNEMWMIANNMNTLNYYKSANDLWTNIIALDTLQIDQSCVDCKINKQGCKTHL
jgi:hypothetical protein